MNNFPPPPSSLDDLIDAYQKHPDTPIQLPPHPSEQNKIFDALKNRVNNAPRNDSQPYIAWIVALAEQTRQPAHYAIANWVQGLVELHYEPRLALTYLQSARTYYQEQGETYLEGRVLIGIIGMMGQLGMLAEADEALQLAKQYLREHPEYPGWPGIYLNESDICRRSGRFPEMLTAAQKAEKMAEERGDNSVYVMALINQAMAQIRMGQLDSATDLLARAYKIASENSFATERGVALMNLAHIHVEQGALLQSLHDLDEARRIFVDDNNTLHQATVALEQVPLFAQLHMPREALRTAVFAAERLGQDDIQVESAKAYILAIRLALQQGKMSKARQFITAAQKPVAKASLMEQAWLRAYTAHPRLQQNESDRYKAREHVKQAIKELTALGVMRELLDVHLLAAGLMETDIAAAAYTDIAYKAEQSDYLGLAIEAWQLSAHHLPPAEQIAPLQHAVHLIAESRRQMTVDELKATLLSGNLPIYRRLAEAQLKTADPIGALQTLLAAKGDIWSDLAQSPPPSPPDPAWQQARIELLHWQESKKETRNPEYRKHCQQKVQEAEAQLARLSRLRGRQRPFTPLPSIETIRNNIPNGAVVVEFLMSETTVYACLLTHNDSPVWVQLEEKTAVSRLLSHLNLMLHTLQTAVPAQRSQKAKAQEPIVQMILGRLYEALLRPLSLPANTPLILIPDDFLFTVPWTALRAEDGYVGELHTVAIMPSAAMVGLPKTAVAIADKALLLGYEGDPPLQYIEDELAGITAVLPVVKQVLPARSDDLMWERPYRYLHIAAHGQVQAQDPLLSRLWLADGAYLLADALRLPLYGTELVTLSACDTGTMPERGGIALALSGAFLMAGAQAVLSSLWPVDDAATKEFMQHFYAALVQGVSLPASLQQAQKQMLDGEYTHPFYWAAFQPMMRRL